MSKFLKHFTGSIFRRKCLHREHMPACFIIVIVGIKCYKRNLFDIHGKDGLYKPLRTTSEAGELIGEDDQGGLGNRLSGAHWALPSPGAD